MFIPAYIALWLMPLLIMLGSYVFLRLLFMFVDHITDRLEVDDLDNYCGHCKYCIYDEYTDDYCCMNADADDYGNYTRYWDTCKEFKRKTENDRSRGF